MDNQRCPEGYAVVVHSRAEAYPLQGWFERRQSTTLRHPTRKQGAGCTSPPRAGGFLFGEAPRASSRQHQTRAVRIQTLYRPESIGTDHSTSR